MHITINMKREKKSSSLSSLMVPIKHTHDCAAWTIQLITCQLCYAFYSKIPNIFVWLWSHSISHDLFSDIFYMSFYWSRRFSWHYIASILIPLYHFTHIINTKSMCNKNGSLLLCFLLFFVCLCHDHHNDLKLCVLHRLLHRVLFLILFSFFAGLLYTFDSLFIRLRSCCVQIMSSAHI